MHISKLNPRVLSKPKVATLGYTPTPEESRQLIREMKLLREKELLTTLRGGRLTDLARPLTEGVRLFILHNCPTLQRVVRALEESLEGTGYFVRTLKVDEPRASSTSPSDDPTQTNMHFDSEKTPVEEFRGPIHQFFGNLGQQHRTFRYIDVPFDEMQRIVGERATPQEILRDFMKTVDFKPIEIHVPSGHIAGFDGAMYAHDAGKNGTEPDMVVTIDHVNSGFHEGYYDPNQSFLEDQGTEAWWQLMAQ